MTERAHLSERSGNPISPTQAFDYALIARLTRHFRDRGQDLYLVGGSVRDQILGRPTHDLDFATSALPEQTEAILQEARPSSVYVIGQRFGTVGAIFGDVAVEITTYRGERYEVGSRKPEVHYGVPLYEDLARRDFTINAMAYDALGGQTIDPFGGTEDLRVGLIRAVGDPALRFAEDPLRLMRAVRFSAQLGFNIEEKTVQAIATQAGALATVSRERVLDEMNRILLSPYPARGVRQLVELNLADVFIPEICDLQKTTQGKRSKDVFEHTLRVLERTRADLVLRWAALLHDIGKPRTFTQTGNEIHFPGHEAVGERLARDILTRLRADHVLIDAVGALTGMHMRANQYETEWTDGAVRRLVREAGGEFLRLLELSEADVTSYKAVKIEAAMRRVRSLRERVERLDEEARIEEIESPLNGEDLMAIFGHGPGPWIKVLKDYLLNLVIEGQLKSGDVAHATDLAQQFVREHADLFRGPVGRR